jgi:hypothetical protein
MATVDSIPSMQHRSERVLLETSRYRISGLVTLPRDGYRSRVSDFLNSSERDFISLTDVSIQALDYLGNPGQPVQRDFLAVARQHIVLATTLRDGES